MKRRKFVCALGTLPMVASALAQSGRPVTIGWFLYGSREAGAHLIAAFREGMSALGYKEGAGYVIEERWADGRSDRLPVLAQDLARSKPPLIVASPSQPVAAAAKAMPGTPIVHATGSDPVVIGFAASLAKPGGMITGITNMVNNLSEKHVELLLTAAPKVKRVGFLNDSTNMARVPLYEAAKRSIARFPVEARFDEVGKADDIEPAIARLASEGVQALIVIQSPILQSERKRVINLALARHWPVVSGPREITEAGGLLSYGVDPAANHRRAAYFVDRILKGAKPGDLPFEQPTKVELVINRRTAKALGLVIPDVLLLQADKVID